MIRRKIQVVLGRLRSIKLSVLGMEHSRRKESSMNDQNGISRAGRRVWILAIHAALFTAPMASAAIRVDVSASPNPARIGEAMDLELTITNDDAFTRSGVVVTLDFPGDVEGLSISLMGSRFDGTSCREVGNDNKCTTGEQARFLLGDLAPGKGTTISIPPRVAAATLDGTIIDFDVEVFDDLVSEGADTASITVNATRSLDLAVATDRDPVPTGELLTYTMAYGVLDGSASIASPRLALSVPTGTTFVSATGGGSLNAGVVEWPFSTFLSGGMSGAVRMTVQVDAGTPDASILTTQAVFENLSGSLERVEYSTTTRVQADNALELVMVASPDPVRPGETVGLELTITNDTGLPRTGVLVTLDFPSGLDNTPIAQLGSYFDSRYCKQVSNDNLCTSRERAGFLLGDLAPGEGKTISIPPRVFSETLNGKVIKFDASVTDATGNTRRTGTVFTVLDTRSLQLAVVVDRDPVPTGALLTYRLTYGLGQDSGDVSDGIISMAVPSGTCFVSASDGGTLNGDVVEWFVGLISPGGGGERLLSVRAGAEEGRIAFARARFRDGAAASTRVEAETSTRIWNLSPLTLDIVASPNLSAGGDALEIAMSVTNTTPLPRPGIVLRLEFPDGLNGLATAILDPFFDSASCRQVSNNDQCTRRETARFLLGELAPGEEVIVVVPPIVATGLMDGELIRFDAFVTDSTGFQAADTDVIKVGTLFDTATAIPPFTDCNANGNPDSCDIADGVSLDVDPADGVPDECVVWTATGGNDFWSNPNNWDILIVPNNIDDKIFIPTLSGVATDVTLDIDVAVDTLRILDAAQLGITDGSLTLEQLGLINDGLVMVGSGRAIIADADIALTGSGMLRLAASDASLSGMTESEAVSNKSTIVGVGMIAAALRNEAGEGVVRADIPSGVLSIQGGIKQNDSMFESVGGATLEIANTAINGSGFYIADGGTIAVRPGSTTATVSGQFMEITNGGTFDINGDASLSLSGDLLIDSCRSSTALMSEAPSRDSLRSIGTVAGGCTPPRKPKLSVSALASVNVQGSLLILADAQVVVTAAFSDLDDAGVTLAGNCENQSTSPSDFDWATGSLSLNGTADQTFEVAGEDFGAVQCGFENNFAMGTFEVQSGSVLDLTNTVANGPGGSDNCNEAVYVDTLILRTGSTLRPSGGNLYYRHLIIDGDGTINTDFACGDVIKVLVEDRDCDADVDLRDVAAFMVCFGATELDANWASCKWANFSVDGAAEEIDLTDYALFNAALVGVAGGPK